MGATTHRTQRPRDSGEDPGRRRELALFLRTMRERLDPAEALGADRTRRRAPGWLREEVAFAAGISATWYVWLEQARPVRASPRALNGLARALKLDRVGRDYLFRLARQDLDPAAGEGDRDPSNALRAFVAGLSPHPAYVLDRRWDVVHVNAEAERLFGGFDLSRPLSRNLIGRLFTDPALRTLMRDWPTIVASAVGQFRAATTTLSEDDEHRALVEQLSIEDATFRTLWQARDLADAPNWLKTFDHPDLGALTFRHTTVEPAGADAGFRVTIYTPACPRAASVFPAAALPAAAGPGGGEGPLPPAHPRVSTR